MTGNPRAVTAVELDIGDLVAGSRQDFRVRAVNDEGTCAWNGRRHADQTTTGTDPAGGVTVSDTLVEFGRHVPDFGPSVSRAGPSVTTCLAIGAKCYFTWL